MTPSEEAAGMCADLAAVLPCPGAAIAVVPVAGARLAALPPEERDHAARFAVRKRREEWISGRLAAREALDASLTAAGRPGLTASLTITTEPGVAPRVLHAGGGMGLGISISHAGGMAAAIAFPAATPFGIDLEPIADLTPGLGKLALSPGERALHEAEVLEGEDAVISLLRYWTAKEAAVKLTGTGFAVPFQRVVVTGQPGHPAGCRVDLPATAAGGPTSCRVRTVRTGRWIAALAWFAA